MANISTSSLKLDTIPKRVQFLAENCPDRELFVFYSGDKRTSFTCEHVFRLAGRFASRLRHVYGFKRSDVIANTLPNSPERMITDLGITLAGCTCLNGQVLLADGSDMFLSAKNSRCRGIVLKPEQDSSAWRLFHPYIKGDVSGDITTLSCDSIPELTSVILVSRTSEGSRRPLLEDLTNSTDDIFIDPTVCAQDILYVFTTSGSTGYSKLVPRTQAEVISIGGTMEFTKDIHSFTSAIYCDRSLGWIGGYPFTAYCVGEKRVMQDWYSRHGRKTGEEIWNAICKEKCTTVNTRQLDVESVVKYIDSIGGTDYKLKTLMTGGQPVTQTHVANQLVIAEDVKLAYGSTEAGILTMAFLKDASVEDFLCGKPLPGVELKILDDNGDECQPGQTGTIIAKGPHIFKGYFNRIQDPDPNTVKCFTKDGWFNTEDLGFQDEDGNLYVMGRNKDTITYGTIVLYPGWLEAEILKHTDIADAVVLPVSDPIKFHEICACVTPVSGCDLTEGQLKTYCESIFIADLASEQTPMPKYFMVSDPIRFHEICACVTPVSGCDLTEEKLKTYCESIFIADLASEQTPMPKYFMVLTSFPETHTGKPDKQLLRKLAEERFGVKSGHAIHASK